MREGSMLPTMNPREDGSGQARFFWDMLRAEGGAIGMFPGPLGDRPHLQDFDDAIDSAHYLGVLLNRVGEMRWAGYTVDHHRHYECDLGYRGKMFNVGTSIQIWNRRAPVTTKMLNEARAQPSNPTGITAPAVGSDVDKMRDKLRKDFETADTRWTEWTNV